MTSTVRDRALAWIRGGYAPLPLPFREKAPAIASWPKLRITEADIDQYFNGEPQNLGLLLGEPSNDLVDVDLDALECTITAEHLLPASFTFGRNSSRRSHRFYRAHGLKTRKFQFKGEMLVELRSTGCQTMIPPSVHPSGEHVEFDATSQRAAKEMTAAALDTAVAKVAAAGLIARHWAQSSGTRHELALALAGALLHSAWPGHAVQEFMDAVLAAAHDEEATDRQRAVVDSIVTFKSGGLTTGWPSVSELLAEDIVQHVKKWLNIGSDATYGLNIPGNSVAPVVDDWPECAPLDDGLLPVPAFPESLLPRPFQTWVPATAERTRCPVEYVAVSAMVAAACAVGWRAAVVPIPLSEWLIPCNLWGLNIGSSGTAKTHAMRSAMHFLWEVEEAWAEEHGEELKAWQALELVNEERRGVLKKAIKTAVENSDDSTALAEEMVALEPSPPQPRRLTVNDTTVEALIEVLAANPNGVLVCRDELLGLLRALDRDNQSHARAFYLECYSGTGRYNSDRIGRGHQTLRNGCISLLGCITPGPFSHYVKDALKGESGDDGFLARLQLMVWPDSPVLGPIVDTPDDAATKSVVRDALHRLATGDLSAFSTQTHESAPEGCTVCAFDDAAQAVFRKYRQDIEQRVRSESFDLVAAHLAKYPQLVPRLALLIHLLEDTGGPVSSECVVKACAWTDVLEKHARRVYGSAGRPLMQTVRRLAGRLADGSLMDGFTVRDVYRHGWSGLSTSGPTQEAIDVLADLGYIRPRDTSGTGRKTTRYAINPTIKDSNNEVADRTDKTDESETTG